VCGFGIALRLNDMVIYFPPICARITSHTHTHTHTHTTTTTIRFQILCKRAIQRKGVWVWVWVWVCGLFVCVWGGGG